MMPRTIEGIRFEDHATPLGVNCRLIHDTSCRRLRLELTETDGAPIPWAARLSEHAVVPNTLAFEGQGYTARDALLSCYEEVERHGQRLLAMLSIWPEDEES